MTQRQKKQVEKVMQTLHGQRFYDFYKDGGKWDDYISNRIDNKKMEKEIREEIKELFNIK